MSSHTSSPSTAPAGPAPADGRLAPLLGRVRAAVDRLLASWPSDPDVAAHRLVAELGIPATDGLLRVLARVAADPSRRGPRHDWPRELLTLRALAARQLHELAGPGAPDPARMFEVAEEIPPTLAAAAALDAHLAAADVEPADRQHLLAVRAELALPRRELEAARLVAGRVAQFIERVGEAGTPGGAPTSLTDEELRLLGRALAAGTMEPAARASVEALALRTLLEDELARAGAAMRRVSNGPESRASVARVRGRLQVTGEVYHTVANRLQQAQINATMAGRHVEAEELRAVGRTLYAAHRQTLPLLREDRLPPVAAAGPEARRRPPDEPSVTPGAS